jgi:hypothetical protein
MTAVAAHRPPAAVSIGDQEAVTRRQTRPGRWDIPSRRQAVQLRQRGHRRQCGPRRCGHRAPVRRRAPHTRTPCTKIQTHPRCAQLALRRTAGRCFSRTANRYVSRFEAGSLPVDQPRRSPGGRPHRETTPPSSKACTQNREYQIQNRWACRPRAQDRPDRTWSTCTRLQARRAASLRHARRKRRPPRRRLLRLAGPSRVPAACEGGRSQQHIPSGQRRVRRLWRMSRHRRRPCRVGAGSRRSLCTYSVGAGARRWRTRRSPCTFSVGARARRRPRGCIPCIGSVGAGARRRPTRRSPCTVSVGAGARRRPTRRSPRTGSVGAGARRRRTRRSPCTGSVCAGARRRLTRRSPCTYSVCAGARRRLTRRSPCTYSVGAGACRRPWGCIPCRCTFVACADKSRPWGCIPCRCTFVACADKSTTACAQRPSGSSLLLCSATAGPSS